MTFADAVKEITLIMQNENDKYFSLDYEFNHYSTGAETQECSIWIHESITGGAKIFSSPTWTGCIEQLKGFLNVNPVKEDEMPLTEIGENDGN